MLSKFKWGWSFLTQNKQLLHAYATCLSDSDVQMAEDQYFKQIQYDQDCRHDLGLSCIFLSLPQHLSIWLLSSIIFRLHILYVISLLLSAYMFCLPLIGWLFLAYIFLYFSVVVQCD